MDHQKIMPSVISKEVIFLKKCIPLNSHTVQQLQHNEDFIRQYRHSCSGGKVTLLLSLASINDMVEDMMALSSIDVSIIFRYHIF